MRTSIGRSLLAALIVCAGVAPASASAGTQDRARVALHVKARTAKASTLCATWSPNAQGVPCSDYATSWPTGYNCDVYLVVAHGDPTFGISSVNCRVSYDGVAGQGVDMYGWTLCADAEAPEDGGFGEWPASNSANRITWNSATNCQRTTVGDEGLHAIAGAFYVYAYSWDMLSVVPPDPVGAVKDCLGNPSNIFQNPAAIAFSPGGTGVGANPCEESPYLPTCPILPDNVSFTSTWSGGFRDSTIVFQNPLSTAVQWNLSISGSEFSLPSGGGPFEIAPSGTLPVTIRFAPGSWGTRGARLLTGSCRGVELTGYANPSCSFAPRSLGFGSTAIGDGKTLPVVLTNVHPEPLSGTVSVSGTGFRLHSGSGAFSLASGESATFEIDFVPTNTGSRTGSVSSGGLCAAVSLSGTGIAACGVTPSTRNFGSVAVGNTGDMPISVVNNLSWEIAGQVTASGPPFTIVSGGAPYALGPGEIHSFTLRFAPTQAGLHTGTVSLGTPCGDVSVSGTGRTGATACSILPGSDFNFGLAQVGVGKSDQLRFTNSGEIALTLLFDATRLTSSFQLPNGTGPFTVAAGGSLDVPVRFVPTTTGVHVATLPTGSACGDVHLSGFGQSSPLACLADASALDFGDVPLDVSREQTFYLFNYSGAPVYGQVFAQCGDFDVLSKDTYQIAWADSHEVRVRFTPRALGEQSCAIGVLGGCADTVSVVGRGIAPPDTARARPWIYAATRPQEPIQRLAYEILSAAHVEILVFDVVGHGLARFDEGFRAAGSYEVSWDARLRPAGIYFARITAGQASLTRRVLLLR